jgi:sensor histidine kinase YesM
MLVILVCCAGIAKAQDTVLLHPQPHWDYTYDMNLYTAFYVDSTNSKDIGSITKETFAVDTAFRAHMRQRYGGRVTTVWMRWILRNPSDSIEHVSLLFNRLSFLAVYYTDSAGTHFIKNNLHFFYAGTKEERRTFRLPVAPGATVAVYGRMYNAYRNFITGYPVIIRSSEYPAVIQEVSFLQRYFAYVDVLFLSIIFFIALHTLAQYFFNNKRKEFLLYAFYAGCVFVFFLFKVEESIYIDILFSHFPTIQKYGNNVMSYIVFFAYYRFVRSFVDFKAIAPWFYRLILFSEKLLLVAMAADLTMAFSNLYPLRSACFNGLRIYLILMAFTGIWLLFRSRKALSLFIAIGSGFLVLGALSAMVLSWLQEGPYVTMFDPIIYMQLGMVLELLCFTLGLSYKTSLIEKEKIIAQQQLIGQLEENTKLQDELTNKLESRVAEQTSRIIVQQQQLEKEKEQQLTLEFQKKLTEMELQLLKSQLNPHFYFNTLNNLYGLSMIAPKKAPDAILKLSDIMEYVIYDCKTEKVPLNKELKFISSYVDLERLRYDEATRIELVVSGESNGYQVSPLLLIQFVENAFKHGMEENKASSFLSIHINVAEGWLHYHSVNSISQQDHQHGGVGLENVKKRLDILYAGRHELVIDTSMDKYIVNLKLQLA